MKLNELIQNYNPILLHYTSINNAHKILHDKQFKLSIALGTQTDLTKHPNNMPFFLSTTRSTTGEYHKYSPKQGAIFVLNKTYLQYNYKIKPVDYWDQMWIKAPGHTKESEDRIFSQKPTIPAQYPIILEIHLFIHDLQNHNLQNYLKLCIKEAKKSKIPCYVYTNNQAWKMLRSSHSIPLKNIIKQLKPIIQPNNKTYKSTQPLNKYKELILKSNIKQLSQQAKNLLNDLKSRWYQSPMETLAADLHNARSPTAPDYNIAKFITMYMIKNKLPTVEEFVKHLKNKWI